MCRETNWRMSPTNPGASVRLLLLGGLIALLSGCSSTGDKDSAPGNAPDLSGIEDAVPKVEPKSKYGNPKSYVVFGKRYYTKGSSKGHVERGLASWYGKKFHGRKTSSGERYDMHAMTAAHKTLPLPTYARVTNVSNGRSAVVKINDRGPFHGKRVIDLSYSAARKLGVVAKGTAMVEVAAIDPSRPESDGKNSFLASANEPAKAKARRQNSFLASADEPVKAHRQNSFLASAEEPPKAKTPARKRVVVAQKTPAAKKPTPSSQDTGTRVAKTEGSRALAMVAPVRAAETTEPTAPAPKVAVATAQERPKKALGSAMYLQVGAFGSRTNAEQLRRRLVSNIAEQVQVRTIDGNEAPLFKVHVGPLDSRKNATDLSQRLASLGLEGSHIVVE